MYEHHVIFEGFVVELLRILVFNFSKKRTAMGYTHTVTQMRGYLISELVYLGRLELANSAVK
jgi:hypothetical protein